TSQIEALIVAFSLIWKIATISFTDKLSNSSERKGNKRFTKELQFTKNMDILNILFEQNNDELSTVFLHWLGINQLEYDSATEYNLLELLWILSEEAVYKLTDENSNDILFTLRVVYSSILTKSEPVDIDDSNEAKGPLRILKNIVREDMSPYLTNEKYNLYTTDEEWSFLEKYTKRVNNFHSLLNTKDIINEEFEKYAIIDNPNKPQEVSNID